MPVIVDEEREHDSHVPREWCVGIAPAPVSSPGRVDHRALIDTLTDMMSRGHWPAVSVVFAPDAVLEYPQSGELFRGIDNIRGEFED